jgi:6,7-dimethyl-8-ribityllumazine synthase
MSRHTPQPIELKIPPDARVAVVAARWNADIVEALLAGCVARLRSLGIGEANLDVHRVPGAYELPVAAKMCVKSRRFYNAVILIGCVIRGDTAHFDYVAGEAARGIQQVGIDSGVPCIFGVLTVENHQQALDRAGGSHGHAGEAAAEAAAEMIALARTIQAAR